jgi:hypothetical protein
LCDEWGGQRTYPTITWARPLSAQLSALELSNATIERVVRCLSQPAPRGDDLRRKRLERQRRELALDHAAGPIGDAEYLAAVGRVREQDEAVPAPAAAPDPAHAVQRLRDFAGLWKSRSEAERAALLGAVYARVEVRGDQFIAAHLTADAKELGLTVALPGDASGRRRYGPHDELSAVVWRLATPSRLWSRALAFACARLTLRSPVRTGTDPRFSVLPAKRVIRIPIAGREEWEQAAQRTA